MTDNQTKGIKGGSLKPCPFCGDNPDTTIYQDEDLHTHNIVDWHQVYCGCDAAPNISIPMGYSCGSAYELWNTRATPKTSGEVVLSLTRDEAESILFAVKSISDLYCSIKHWCDLTQVIRSQTKGGDDE